MKKRWLQIGSLLIALLMLWVSADWDVKFHYCTETHVLLGSFGLTADLCPHCQTHEHEHDHAHEAPQAPHDERAQLNQKCCCEDFEQLVQFADGFVFSPEKHLNVFFQAFTFINVDLLSLPTITQKLGIHGSILKIPIFVSGREMLVYFSSLKLNPLVF